MRPDEKIGIVSRDGVSYLTLDDVTYDHAGKYQVSVENPSGKDQRFFSLAVEGKVLFLFISAAFATLCHTQKLIIPVAIVDYDSTLFSTRPRFN